MVVYTGKTSPKNPDGLNFPQIEPFVCSYVTRTEPYDRNVKMFRTLVILVLGLTIIACDQSIGDECTISSNCAQGQVCDTTMPGGYCTLSSCTFVGCPSEAVCVEFTDFESFCMLRCDSSSDCRTDYSCVDLNATSKFCAPTETSERDESP